MNRKLLAALLATGIVLVSASCTRKTVSMDDVDSSFRANATGYIEAMANYDVASARPFATEETANITLNGIEHILASMEDSSFISQNTPAVITYDSVVFRTDTSATVYFRKQTPIQPNVSATLDMRLRNGQWLAHQVVDFSVRIGPASAGGVQ